MTILEAVNIVLRGISLPPVAAIGDDPEGTEAESLVNEVAKRTQELRSWYLRSGTTLIGITGTDGQWRHRARVVESVSGAAGTLLIIGNALAWIELEKGSVAFTGGQTLTGTNPDGTVFTRTGVTATALPPDAAWSFAQLPPHWQEVAARQGALEFFRAKKNGGEDRQLVEAASSARQFALQEDVRAGGATAASIAVTMGYSTAWNDWALNTRGS
jgi:hypothetical protein